MFQFYRLLYSSVLCLAAFAVTVAASSAEENQVKKIAQPRFTLYVDLGKAQDSSENFIVDLADHSVKLLEKNIQELSRVLGFELQHNVVLRFMSPQEFHKQTGAPEWTNAMYYNGEIIVPLDPKDQAKIKGLSTALRHELVHAFTADLSGSRCPAWLDEGLAQLLEGRTNPTLPSELRYLLKSGGPLPLNDLEAGFMTLDERMVPAAYAQSLFVARNLVQKKGFTAMRNYLKALSRGISAEQAFSLAFEIEQKDFERGLHVELARWSNSEAVLY